MLKRLERLGKRLATNAIRALLPNDARGERPDWRARKYRVLFLRHDRIGDMILSTGILRAIAEAHPTIELDVLASPINAAVLRNEPYVHEIVVAKVRKPASYVRTLRELRRRRYDAVIDCMVTAPSLTTLLLMLATGARHRIGVAGRGNDFAYTLPVPPRAAKTHLVDQLGALVAAFGLDPDRVDLRPRIQLSDAERARGQTLWRRASGDGRRDGPRVLVNVSAGRAHHAWPDERFVSVVRAVRERTRDADVAVVSAPGDRARATRIASDAGARVVEDEGIRDAFALVAGADVVFTPDTSIGHACSALGKPAIVLHPKGNAAAWSPYGTDGVAIESATPDVTGITAEEASRALLARFASRSAR